MAKAIYIHIPFCKRKCYYCDFLSFANLEDKIPEYIENIKKEIKMYDKNIYDSVYFGGGTPSILDVKYIRKILNELKIKKNSEITLEVNPNTVDLQKLRELKKVGINRLSIGFQSFNDETLKSLGRIHTSDDAIKTYNDSRKAGFDNINLDLIFSTPGQTMDKLKSDLRKISELNPEHIAIYSLIWKKGSKLWEMRENKEVKEIENDLEAKMYEYIIKYLKDSWDYSHYEISNFCKRGYRSKHNTKYWKNEEYVGVGLGASGYINDTRYVNEKSFENYYKKIGDGKKPISEKEILNNRDTLGYKNMLGLRMIKDGVIITDKEFVKIADKLCKQGYLLNKEDRYILSKKGLMFANQVFMEFI